jgi:nucleoside triphosphate diphosphatase
MHDERLGSDETSPPPSSDDGANSILASVPRSLPTLVFADLLQRRAAEVGFDWPDMTGVFAKVHEEVDELATAEPGDHQEEEMGDLLFSLVNLARKMGISSERALQRANQKFLSRFASIEAACRRQGVRPNDLTLDELDAFWNEAKAKERAHKPPS